MAAPIPKWLNPDGSACLSWDAGIVDADSTSDPPKEVWIWNNKGTSAASPSTDVADMTNVFVTTKNTDGTDTGSVATRTDAIVEVATFDGANWSEFTEVGGSSNTVQVVSCSGVTGTISGKGNDGNPLTTLTQANFAKLKLRLHVRATAPAGSISWKTRVSYQYTS